MGFTYRILNSLRIFTKTKDILRDDYLKEVRKIVMFGMLK